MGPGADAVSYRSRRRMPATRGSVPSHPRLCLHDDALDAEELPPPDCHEVERIGAVEREASRRPDLVVVTGPGVADPHPPLPRLALARCLLARDRVGGSGVVE